MDMLKLFVEERPIDILTISETWLKPSTFDSEFHLDGYSSVRKDRLDKVIYIRDGIQYRAGSQFGSESMEFCSVEILRPKAKKIVVWSIYRPPSGNIDKFIDEMNGSLENISDRDEVLLLGDFNISWNSKSNLDKSVKRKLVNLANAYGLEQIVDQPTRVTESSSSLIDLIFTNTIHHIKDHGVVDLSSSDHSMVYCVVKAGISNAL